MKISEKFDEITSYQSSNFKEMFGDIKYQRGAAELFSKKLERSMNDKEILLELRPTEISLGELFHFLTTDANKKDFMIFYCKDISLVLRAVGVHWHDDGWRVYASSVVHPDAWSGGRQVFSRNSFDSQNPDTQNLSPSVPLSLVCPHCRKPLEVILK